jgi:ATP/maltotriose-dependent transcriptional regulator MalT
VRAAQVGDSASQVSGASVGTRTMLARIQAMEGQLAQAKQQTSRLESKIKQLQASPAASPRASPRG